MPTNQDPWGTTGWYGRSKTQVGQQKLNPYWIPKYTQGEGAPTLDESGRYYWDYGDPNMELLSEADMKLLGSPGNGEQTNTTGFVTLNGKKFLRVGDAWKGTPDNPQPTFSFDAYGPLTYDEKYGWLADAANVKKAPLDSTFMDDNGLAVVAALGGMVMAPGLGAGLSQSGGTGPAPISGGLSPQTVASLGAVDPASIAVSLPGSQGAGSLASALGAAGGAGSEEQLLEAIRQLGGMQAADPAALGQLQTELLANSQFIDPGAWDAMASAAPGGDFSGAFDTGGWSGSGIFGDDSVWNSLKRFGSNALDKIPSIANALKAAGVGAQPQKSPMLNTSGFGGGGGGGAGGGSPRGNAPQFEQNPFAKLPQKVQAKTLADYLKG